jgi:hypothetical protein
VQGMVSRTKEWRLAAWVTAIDVLIAAGFSLAGLIRPQAILPPDSVPTAASFVFAMYATARTVPVAFIVLVTIYQRWAHALVILGFLAGVIQTCDCLIGIGQHDLGKAVGPLAIAAIQLYAALILNNSIRGRVPT